MVGLGLLFVFEGIFVVQFGDRDLSQEMNQQESDSVPYIRTEPRPVFSSVFLWWLKFLGFF